MINNRELSWLAFNERVLQEAQDKNVPLMQRLRFLGIFSNNQDEFIKVRVANVLRLSTLKDIKIPKLSGGYTSKELLPLLNTTITDSQEIFSQTYREILEEMENFGIYVINETQLNKKQEEFCRDYFSSIISMRLVPLIMRKTTRIPFLRDGNIYHAVKMCSGKTSRYSIIQIPVSSTCPRFITLPSDEGRTDVIFIDDVIRLCLDEIFFMFNYETITAHTFKILRDAQMTIDDDISKSLIEKMEDGIDSRIHGRPIRLTYDKDMPEDVMEIIASKFGLKREEEIAPSGRYHLMKDLMKFPKVHPELEVSNPAPLSHPSIKPFSSILKVIKVKDIFLNYPYHTFNHFIDFLREAAIDPKVEKIYITLYRTAERSKVINALVNAAKNGKQVVVLVELMARFDEEHNVEITDILTREGVKVIHGIDGLKVHSKLVLIERKEGASLKGYTYIGTGNFNESTAQIYGDFGLMTSNNQIAADAKEVFDFLQNTHKHFETKHLLVSPYYMRGKCENLIETEIRNAQKGKKAYIYAKFNSLTDEKIINHLYKASNAGVKIRLIIRGACCLQPQVKGQSENIKVISIVDKFLEHARMAIFCNGGIEKIYILSADWMTRNLDRRVEVGVPIFDKGIQRTLKKVFEIQWSDNVKARDLTIFGQNNYVTKKQEIPCRSQLALYDFYKSLENTNTKKLSGLCS